MIVTATFDSRDTPFNPTRGVAAALEYIYSDESLGAELDWQRIELGVGLAVPVRKDVVWVTLAGGSDLDTDLPLDRTFMLGGPGASPATNSANCASPITGRRAAATSGKSRTSCPSGARHCTPAFAWRPARRSAASRRR